MSSAAKDHPKSMLAAALVSPCVSSNISRAFASVAPVKRISIATSGGGSLSRGVALDVAAGWASPEALGLWSVDCSQAQHGFSAYSDCARARVCHLGLELLLLRSAT